MNPMIKAKALLLKNMFWEYKEINGNVYDENSIRQLYGYKSDLVTLVKAGIDMKSSKYIYNFLMEDILFINNSIIPSRSEKRTENIKWSVAWANLYGLRGLKAEEYDFAWRVQQDLLPTGSRLHRPNAD